MASRRLFTGHLLWVTFWMMSLLAPELTAHSLEAPGGSLAPGAPCVCEECPKPKRSSVLTFSGEYDRAVEDLRVPGRGFDFVWARRYRSRLPQDSAQGNGWDFSYNIRIESVDPDTVDVFDGNGRKDAFHREPDGVTFGRDEFFQVGEFDSEGVFTLTFADSGTWVFHPLDGSPLAGKISQIVDRNGNRLSLHYDTAARLVRVRDTLDRDIVVSYQGNRIRQVTDFSGRSITYTYYGSGDPNGNLGDLASVTSPPVVNTSNYWIPPGHEYPQGKTTIYTYSTGFEDANLNHNLLTVTDPKGQTTLFNMYSNATNPQDLSYDRVVRQVIGNPGDIIDYVYVQPTFVQGGGEAAIRAIINDREGNVVEETFDARNRLVSRRQYTGRADPDAPTGEGVNRPTGKLRSSDPDFFETAYEYNDDSLAVREVSPNGALTVYVYESELDPLASRRSRGNLREVRRHAGGPGGDPTILTESFEYDVGGGGCCGSNFVTRSIDPLGHETVHTYDAKGNRLSTRHPIPSVVEDFEYNTFGQLTKRTHAANAQGHRRVDTFTYYGPEDGGQNGYLREEILDAGGAAITTLYEYNLVGEMIRVVDPRGQDTLFLVNQLNQVLLQTSPEVSAGSGVRYESVRHYDLNDNLVLFEALNLDENGVVRPNAYVTTTYEFDLLDQLIRRSEEVDESRSTVTEFEYDANQNRTRVLYGEATAGRDPHNGTLDLYDERDLLFRRTRGAGSPDESTTQVDYDDSGNQVTLTRGIPGDPKSTIDRYDGFGRLVASTDGMGNVTRYAYDDNGNLLSRTIEGELDDVEGSTSNRLLYEESKDYDAMNRVVECRIRHFDSTDGTSIGDGVQVTTLEYADNSQRSRVTDDHGHVHTFEYDSVNRRTLDRDALGNEIHYAYDAGSNITRVTEVEVSDLGRPDLSFVTSLEFDGLDRFIAASDDAGNRFEFAYDSRSNRTVERDPSGTVTTITYDGLRRELETRRTFSSGTVRTTKAWDDSSRLISRSDANGNTRTLHYDSLDRVTRTVMADGSMHTYAYDVHGNVVREIDRAQTAKDHVYDRVDRLQTTTLTLGPGVSSDTTFEIYRYDGIGRIVDAQDNDSRVLRRFDSLGGVLSEAINGRTTLYERDSLGGSRRLESPGGRLIDLTYDALHRKKVISEGGSPIASYDYVGPKRVERRTMGNATRYEPSYDSARRITATEHVREPQSSIDERQYSWDAMSNKTQIEDVRKGGPSSVRILRYDGLHRLVHSEMVGGEACVYEYDGAGNRLQVTGSPHAGLYDMDDRLPPGDFQTNQYTSTPSDTRRYDENGNLIAIQSNGTQDSRRTRLTYDGHNRLVGLETLTERSRVGVRNPGALTGIQELRRHSYRYDVFHRRIGKTTEIDGVVSETRYAYDGWSVIEESSASGQVQASYVHGEFLDELVQMRRGGEVCYYHADDNLNVVALSDEDGEVVERYEYDDFGSPKFYDRQGRTRPHSFVGNPFLFTGRHFDSETGFYYYRARYLDPSTGRFLSRDPLGPFGDRLHLGNPRTYAGNNPWSRTDPSGLESLDDKINSALAKTAKGAAKKALQKLVDDGFLPPGFADYADVLYSAGAAAVTWGEDEHLRKNVKESQGLRGDKGFVRFGFFNSMLGRFRYSVIHTRRGVCNLIFWTLEEKEVEKKGGGVRRVKYWRHYKTLWDEKTSKASLGLPPTANG